MEKKHAKDYLIEYATSPKCGLLINNVIYHALVTKMDIDDGIIDDIVQACINNTLTRKEFSSIGFSFSSEGQLVLNMIQHEEGVNALASNQTIMFNSEVNVIWGLNGSGKSGYFRILNELAGGAIEKTLHKNIYSENQGDIKVNIAYTYDGKDSTTTWDGSCRGKSPLDLMKVYDDSYLTGLLVRRDADDLIIKPYGLELFSYIASIFDEVKKRCNTKKIEWIESFPSVDFSKINDRFTQIINEKKFLENEKEFESFFSLDTNEIENKIKCLKKEYEEVVQLNAIDKIEKCKSDITIIEGLKKRISEYAREINQRIDITSQLINEYQLAEIENASYKSSIDLLEKIPGSDTEEWKAFIEQGYNFSINNDYDKKCPYCQRLYDSDSMELIKQYATFLKNDISMKMDNLNNQLSIEKETVFSMTKLNKNEYNHEIFSSIQKDVELISMSCEKVKENLIGMLSDKKARKIGKLFINDLLIRLDTMHNEKMDLGDKYSEDELNRVPKMEELKKQIVDLENKLSLIEQKNTIKKIIEEQKRIKKTEKILNVTTSALTALSKQAHNDLLTESIKARFLTILNVIGISNIDIDIISASKKGIPQTEMLLLANSGNLSIREILSEGEQKAIALAMFLAEISLVNNRNPIILDDPVNSLDHKYIDGFATALMELGNQLVVFTHNALFLDFFETTKLGHICKNYKNGCNQTRGRHIFLYESIAETRMRKGVIAIKKTNDANSYIEKMKDLSQISPFTYSEEASTCMRLCVEKIVDEIIFNSQKPTGVSNSNSRIHWGELKKIVNDNTVIDNLERIHGRASGGALHNGNEKKQNPVTKEEYDLFIENLENIISMKSP